MWCSIVDIYKTWTGVHGSTTPWTWSMDQVHGPGPWTTPNFQKEIVPVDMKIYRRSGYEKHRLIFITVALVALGSRPHKWEDLKLVLRYRRSSAFLLNIFIPTLSNCNSISKTPPALLPHPAYYILSCIKISRFMYQSNRSFNIPPPLGIPRAFDAFSCPGGREFDHHS